MKTINKIISAVCLYSFDVICLGVAFTCFSLMILHSLGININTIIK